MNKYAEKCINTLLAVAFIASIFACNDARKPANQPQVKKVQAAKATDPTECLLDKDMHNKYAEHTKRGDHWKAARSISRCADTSKDEYLIAKVKESEIKVWTADFKNNKKTAAERSDAYEKLKELDASEALKLEQEFKIVAKRASYDAEVSHMVIKQNLKHTGATIGMSQTEVIQGNWGYPSHINKTTTAMGTREQWSYDEGKYLYFDNGVLTAIQE